MEFLKKHYEKILLSVVLLGLMVVTLWWLPKTIKEADESQANDSAPVKAKALPPLDMTAERKAMQTATNPQPVVLSGIHNVFNPVTWKKKPDGTLRKILVEGPQALTINAINTNYMTISYDRAAGSVFSMTIQYQSGRKISEYAKLNEKTKSGVFTIREAKGGTPEEPAELVLELAASQETVSVTKGQPYKRAESYTADLKYEPENRTFNKQKVGDTINISGEAYKIIAITSNEVRVQSNTTGKQTPVKWTGTPTP